MNRSRSLFLSLSLAVLLPLASGVLWSAVGSTARDEGSDSLYKYLSIFSEVFGLVRSSYVEPADADALLAGALDGVTDALDPFSSLVPAGELGEYERTQRLAFAHSGLTIAKDHGIAFVVAVEDGSPGAAAGLERGDLISEIGGLETRTLPAWRVERKLAEPPGTEVEVRLLRDGEPSVARVALAEYTPPEPQLDEVRGIARLRISRLAPGTADRVRPLLEELARRGARQLLVDLRDLAGGEGAEAYAVGALFAAGELGRLDERGETARQFSSDAPQVWRGDVAVLVDGGTLGAAEILAAILRDAAGARLVGAPTFGWAGERSYRDLSGGARLHLTTRFFAGPDGRPIAQPLAPEVVVDEFSRRFGETDRPLEELILERAIELLTGAPDAARRAA